MCEIREIFLAAEPPSCKEKRPRAIQKCSLHTGLLLFLCCARSINHSRSSQDGASTACLLAGYLWYFTFCVIIVIDHYSSVSIKNLLIVALRGFYVFYFQWIQYWVVIRGVWMLFYSERATTNRDNVRMLKLLYHIMYCFFLTLLALWLLGSDIAF